MDCPGLVPRTAAWWDYWTIRINQLSAGEKPDVLIPFEVFDVFVRLADAHKSGGDQTERNRPDYEGDQQTGLRSLKRSLLPWLRARIGGAVWPNSVMTFFVKRNSGVNSPLLN